MDCFAMLWMFDARWLFGIRPALYQHLLVFPIITNLCLIATTIYDRIQSPCLAQSWSLAEVLSLKLLLTSIEIGMYAYLSVQRHKRSSKLPSTNKVKICNFYREFEGRKIIWSLAGLLVFLLSFCLLWVNLSYAVTRNCTIFGPKIYFYLSLAFWMYICIMLFGFLLCKGLFLVTAWKCPKAFLKMQNLYSKPTDEPV